LLEIRISAVPTDPGRYDYTKLTKEIIVLTKGDAIMEQQTKTYVCVNKLYNRPFVATVSQLKKCDFSGEMFEGFEVL